MVTFLEFIKAVIMFPILLMRFKINPTKLNETAMMETRSIIVLVIAVYILSALMPSAISSMNAANTSGWSITQTALWVVLTVIIIATVIMKIAE